MSKDLKYFRYQTIEKSQIPSTKFQIMTKHQAPMIQAKSYNNLFGICAIGNWCLFGFCLLLFDHFFFQLDVPC
jgi:hypothetical protein